jgi:nucleoside-diphosphate-sugar epimerase
MKPPAAEPRRAVVTGGAGFIGSHLVEELLRRDARVTVIDDLSSGRADNLSAVRDRVDLEQLDLAREDPRPVLAGADAVFHLAATRTFRAPCTSPAATSRRTPWPR